MQVSCDGICRFIKVQTGKVEERSWYRLDVVDEQKNIYSGYCTAECFGAASRLEFGQECTLVLDIQRGSKGQNYITVVDVVTNG